VRRRNRAAIRNSTPWTWWWDLATQSSEMITASAEVIARRSIQLSSMTTPPSASDQRELTGMVTEKVDAFQRSATAMMTSASTFWMNQWMASAGLGRPRISVANATQASAKILKAGLQPYRQRAVCNAKRLRKKRPSR
jgi:hypothetical protein